jgi:site-specific recombinase XerD
MTPTEVDVFLEHLRERDLAADTIAHYQAALREFFDWFTATTKQTEVVAVTSLDVRQWRDQLKSNQKAGTVNNKLGKLSSFLEWCVKAKLIQSNPAENIKRSKINLTAPKWLTRQETHAILRMAEQQFQMAQMKDLDHSLTIAARTLAMVRLMLNAGLRVSEVCDLKISDVTLGERSGSVLVRYGKGSKQRGIPLNSDARKAILTWLKVRGNEGEYLFIGPDKERMKRQVVTWHIGQLGKKVGLELNPHRLRHTFGKNLVDSGVSLDRVAMLLGHSNLTTTAVYTLPGEGDLQRAVDKISWED